MKEAGVSLSLIPHFAAALNAAWAAANLATGTRYGEQLT
jgi:hypothetical protein